MDVILATRDPGFTLDDVDETSLNLANLHLVLVQGTWIVFPLPCISQAVDFEGSLIVLEPGCLQVLYQSSCKWPPVLTSMCKTYL
eukprot:3630454-Amphidinium_carterae.1